MTWTCPKCGKPNLMEQKHCNRCGTSRPGGYHHKISLRVKAYKK